tara:strand:+ start:81 stop:407 length:327 start_codon:yes stop_codon:yes gene_type:complete
VRRRRRLAEHGRQPVVRRQRLPARDQDRRVPGHRQHVAARVDDRQRARIESEWNLIENYIKQNSYVIFDDLWLKGVQQFRDWFKNKYQNQYEYKEENYGHKQFIVKKL